MLAEIRRSDPTCHDPIGREGTAKRSCGVCHSVLLVSGSEVDSLVDSEQLYRFAMKCRDFDVLMFIVFYFLILFFFI